MWRGREQAVGGTMKAYEPWGSRGIMAVQLRLMACRRQARAPASHGPLARLSGWVASRDLHKRRHPKEAQHQGIAIASGLQSLSHAQNESCQSIASLLVHILLRQWVSFFYHRLLHACWQPLACIPHITAC